MTLRPKEENWCRETTIGATSERAFEGELEGGRECRLWMLCFGWSYAQEAWTEDLDAGPAGRDDGTASSGFLVGEPRSFVRLHGYMSGGVDPEVSIRRFLELPCSR